MTEFRKQCLCDKRCGIDALEAKIKGMQDLLDALTTPNVSYFDMTPAEEIARLEAIVTGQDSNAIQAAWDRLGKAPDPRNPGWFVCNQLDPDQWEALRRALFNEPQDQ